MIVDKIKYIKAIIWNRCLSSFGSIHRLGQVDVYFMFMKVGLGCGRIRIRQNPKQKKDHSLNDLSESPGVRTREVSYGRRCAFTSFNSPHAHKFARTGLKGQCSTKSPSGRRRAFSSFISPHAPKVDFSCFLLFVQFATRSQGRFLLFPSLRSVNGVHSLRSFRHTLVCSLELSLFI